MSHIIKWTLQRQMNLQRMNTKYVNLDSEDSAPAKTKWKSMAAASTWSLLRCHNLHVNLRGWDGRPSLSAL